MMVAALVSASFTSCIEEIDPQTSTVTEQQAKDAPGAFDNFVANLTGNLSGQFIYGGDSHYVFDFGYPAFFLVRDVMGQDIVPVGTNNWFDTWYQDFNYLSPNYARTQFPWTLYFGWIKDCNIVENDGDSSWGSVMMLENGFDCGYAANYGGPNVIDRHLYETIPASDYRKMCWVDFELEDLIDPDAEDIPSDLLNALSAYSDYPERIYAAGVDNASYGLGGLSVKFRNAAGKANVKYDAWVVAVPLMRVEEMMLIEAEAAGMQSEAKGIELLTKFAKARDPYYTYGTHRDAYYNTSTSQFQNEVWWQRRVELWGEGFATFDIKRLNKGVIRSYPGTNHIEGSRFNVNTVPNWMVWCFVNTEAQYNESLVKNPDPVRPAGDSDEFAW